MLGLEKEIGCLVKRCPVLILTVCPMAETAAAARKGDPSLPPLKLSTMSSAVEGCNLQEGNLELHSGIQGSQTAEVSSHEIS